MRQVALLLTTPKWKLVLINLAIDINLVHEGGTNSKMSFSD